MHSAYSIGQLEDPIRAEPPSVNYISAFPTEVEKLPKYGSSLRTVFARLFLSQIYVRLDPGGTPIVARQGAHSGLKRANAKNLKNHKW